MPPPSMPAELLVKLLPVTVIVPRLAWCAPALDRARVVPAPTEIVPRLSGFRSLLSEPHDPRLPQPYYSAHDRIYQTFSDFFTGVAREPTRRWLYHELA
jgi:hypothetical protein